MNESKGQKVYKIVMLVVITIVITAIVTTMVVYNKVTEKMSFQILTNADANSSGLELTLSKIRTMLEKNYIGDLDDEKMLEGAIKGYVAGVGDEYTEYYTEEEMNNELDEANGSYVGIGIYMLVDSVNGKIIVSKPMENSPAEQAGIKTGDIIVKVEGEEVTKENVSGMSNKIKGEEGTKVLLEVLRGEETLSFSIERKRIVITHIEARILEKNIGYIYIKDFDGGVAEEFNTKYKELEEKGIKSLVIDVRSNGGGVVNESLKILDMLLEKDSIELITFDKAEKEVVTKSKTDKQIDIPIIVLTNSYSASASEIFAGALKDNGRAKLVGIKTYGKGVIQSLIKLSDGSGLKMTTEEYYTPNKNKINKVGIDSDYEVKFPEDLKELTDENDTQLRKAIDLLK